MQDELNESMYHTLEVKSQNVKVSLYMLFGARAKSGLWGTPWCYEHRVPSVRSPRPERVACEALAKRARSRP